MWVLFIVSIFTGEVVYSERVFETKELCIYHGETEHPPDYGFKIVCVKDQV